MSLTPQRIVKARHNRKLFRPEPPGDEEVKVLFKVCKILPLLFALFGDNT
ncbi:MAG: hypothetical protein HQL80_11295 [Magnetococcales bacterium]|nr:hypothetical protein [Magnetococcales bacterium]